MAGELQIKTNEASITVYALVFNAAGEIWDTTGTPAFESPVDAQIGNYDIALTEQGTDFRRYIGDMPAASAGYISIEFYKQVGGSPALTDLLIGTDEFYWSGTAIIRQTGDSFARIGANGAGLTDLATSTELAKVPKSDGSSTWNSTALASIQSEAADALNAYDPPTNAEMEARTLVAADYFDPATDAIPWNAAWDAEVQSEVVDALQETVPDSVPADGSRPNIQQALYLITQMLTEFAISGTTYTVKKPDGSTTLLTLTLNDATDPTALTRAT